MAWTWVLGWAVFWWKVEIKKKLRDSSLKGDAENEFRSIEGLSGFEAFTSNYGSLDHLYLGLWKYRLSNKQNLNLVYQTNKLTVQVSLCSSIS